MRALEGREDEDGDWEENLPSGIKHEMDRAGLDGKGQERMTLGF